MALITSGCVPQVSSTLAYEACDASSGDSSIAVDWQSCLTQTYTASLFVDTSASGFSSTPVYVASLGALSDPGMKITGGGGVYSPSISGFTVYLQWTGLETNTASATLPADNGFHINWIAVREGYSSTGLSAGYSAATSWAPASSANGVVVDVDTTMAGWTGGSFIPYMTSLQAEAGPVWLADGAATVVSGSAGGFRVYLSQGATNSTTVIGPAPEPEPAPEPAPEPEVAALPACVDTCSSLDLACAMFTTSFLVGGGCGNSCLVDTVGGGADFATNFNSWCDGGTGSGTGGETGRRRAQASASTPGSLSMAAFASINGYRVGWVGMLSRCAQVRAPHNMDYTPNRWP